MSGRAGRAGKDDSGESILVVPKQDNQRQGQQLVLELMNAGLPSLKSCLTDQEVLLLSTRSLTYPHPLALVLLPRAVAHTLSSCLFPCAFPMPS